VGDAETGMLFVAVWRRLRRFAGAGLASIGWWLGMRFFRDSRLPKGFRFFICPCEWGGSGGVGV